ncbi:MAG: bifunctional phosphoribosylaminoimidazolecarboxamide formyltransferase/IMP cyclohydrolase [Nitrospirae bacterium]|nr:bifunctional phosphoribosylaminoimidazolecarboxamide formyltransferase/IMP cyclohydrolase [Nitrospirota bacterium]
MSKIKRALISVSNKKGIVDFAKALNSMGIEILSTGGTAKTLRDSGIPVRDVSEYTGFPEMLDGRLKTLHPKIHGGLLSRRNNPKDMEDIKKHGIDTIDLVVVNLYPFEETISRPGVTFAEAIENIDIGGPAMLRSASKNFQDVAVIVDPSDYEKIVDEMNSLNGDLSYRTRVELAKKVFRHTSKYDIIIADYFTEITGEEKTLPETLTMTFDRVSLLRYGENPHQKAAFYKERTEGLSLFNNAKILQGKEMSFNNYLDAHSALMLVLEFDKTACAIIKHNNPCGVALGDTAADAYMKAVKTDPVSAFGGVIAFNRAVDDEAAREITNLFVEVVIAPVYSDGALSTFSKKPNIRLLEMPDMSKSIKGWDMKKVTGGLLLQELDTKKVDILSLKAVTKRQPTPEELEGLSFAWKVCKHVKSNAIVYAFKDRTVGIGIGQTSRVYSAKIGAMNAPKPLQGSVVASDGFFPFRDGIDVLHEVGVTAIVQPGGAIHDNEVIAAADEYNMAMLITGVRHFRH